MPNLYSSLGFQQKVCANNQTLRTFNFYNKFSSIKQLTSAFCKKRYLLHVDAEQIFHKDLFTHS